MKKLITTSLLAGAAIMAHAQGSSSLGQSGCGTITSPQEAQEVYDFVKLPLAHSKTTTTDTIPLTIHIVGKNDGSGYYRLDNLFQVLCQLNDHYAPVGFYFSVKWPIRYINNTNYYEHDFNDGQNMMTTNNQSGSVNVYFVEDPAGTCGYYAPYGGAVAISKGCSGNNSTTLAHELGHFFGLMHTFYGWEGYSTTNPPSNYERVTRGAGANCSTTGDGFCDTEADYLSGRWNCPYTGTYTDANGDAFKPDGSNYMSYSNDACMNHFTPMQIARMQNVRSTKYASVVSGPTSGVRSFSTPSIVYPVDKIYSNYTKVIWKRVPGADVYQVKIKKGSIVQQETVTQDTSLDLSITLSENINYSISVTPLSASNVCQNATKESSYSYTSATTTLSVNDIGATVSAMKLTPNPAQSLLNVTMSDFATGNYQLSMTGVNGQLIHNQSIKHPGGNFTGSIDVSQFPSGIYFVRISGDGQNITQKAVVQH